MTGGRAGRFAEKFKHNNTGTMSISYGANSSQHIKSTKMLKEYRNSSNDVSTKISRHVINQSEQTLKTTAFRENYNSTLNRPTTV